MATPQIEELVKALPTRPGVYIMKGDRGDVLYVGKAVNLRNRVRSYFGSPSGLTPKVRRLVERIDDIETMVTTTELEALLLECSLIKRHRPPFNVRMRDDKAYPYVRVSLNEPFPRIDIARRIASDGARYFGPFADSGSVYRTLSLLKKLFPYRSCTKEITGKDDRPCLDYHIHRCLGPCIAACSREEYGEVIRQAILFLEGKQERVVQQLKQKMLAAADNLEFERAAFLRDQIQAVEKVTERQKVVSTVAEDQDVIAFARDDGEACVQVFFIREGRLIGREHFVLEGTQDEEGDHVMAGFIKQFYDSATYVPPRILIQNPADEMAVIEEWLRQKRGTKVSIQVPRQGERKQLVDMVAENARETLLQLRAKWLADSTKTSAALEELQDQLGLPTLPFRIECYDISNIQGSDPVASMVVFEQGQPQKAHYRRFKIKTVSGPNDFASMAEVLRRRFSRVEPADLKTGQMRRRAAVTTLPLPVLQDDGAVVLTNVPARAEASTGEREGHTRRDAVSPLTLYPSAVRKGDVAPGQLAAEARAEYRVSESSASSSASAGTVPIPSSSPEAAGKRGKQETESDSFSRLPDLVIVDGGKGQVSAALAAMREVGADFVPLAGLAKQNEELFLPGRSDPIVLSRTSPALYLVQRIRDEAHRFAVTYHTKVRGKRSMRSALDEIVGIGPRRKTALLRHFGTIKAIREASVVELAAVPGMTRTLAEKVKAQL